MLGRVKAGLLADLIAVEGEPLKDIDAIISGMRWVMNDGTVLIGDAVIHASGRHEVLGRLN